LLINLVLLVCPSILLGLFALEEALIFAHLSRVLILVANNILGK
jgi:hypothetical protein